MIHELCAAQTAQKRENADILIEVVLDWFYIANLVLVHQWTMDKY